MSYFRINILTSEIANTSHLLTVRRELVLLKPQQSSLLEKVLTHHPNTREGSESGVRKWWRKSFKIRWWDLLYFVSEISARVETEVNNWYIGVKCKAVDTLCDYMSI